MNLVESKMKRVKTHTKTRKSVHLASSCIRIGRMDLVQFGQMILVWLVDKSIQTTLKTEIHIYFDGATVVIMLSILEIIPKTSANKIHTSCVFVGLCTPFTT